MNFLNSLPGFHLTNLRERQGHDHDIVHCLYQTPHRFGHQSHSGEPDRAFKRAENPRSPYPHHAEVSHS